MMVEDFSVDIEIRFDVGGNARCFLKGGSEASSRRIARSWNTEESSTGAEQFNITALGPKGRRKVY